MSREKQIEEMVDDIDAYIESVDVRHWYRDELDEGLAKALYTAGYRKQSENTVEIVRCKDCEHYGLNSPIVKNKHCLYFSGYDEIFTGPNDYCSFAKMKGGAE